MALTQIPTDILTPLVFIQNDASGAATVAGWKPALLVGQKFTTGAATADTTYQVTSAAEVEELAGRGSMLHRQSLAYFASDNIGEVKIYPLADPNPGVAATGKITITGTATEAGLLYLSVGGQKLNISVAVDDTADDVGAAIALALPTNAADPTDYPVSAANAAGVVTFTAKHKGFDAGNFIKLEINPLGVAGRQTTPVGLVVALTNKMGDLVEGSGNPDMSNYATNIGPEDYDMFGLGFRDAEDTLPAVSAELGDDAGRWNYTRGQYGHAIAAYVATSSEASTFGLALDDQHLTVFACEGDDAGFAPLIPNPPYELAAGLAAACFKSLRVDPALPLQTLALSNSLDGKLKWRAPGSGEKWTMPIRNSLLGDGISTVIYSADGKVKIERAVTTSKTLAYRNLNVLFITVRWLRELKAMLESSFGRAKLNANTIRAIKAAVVAKYAELAAPGVELVEDVEGFAASLVIQQNDEDSNRIDILCAPQYVHQLNIVAVNNRLSA